MSIKEIIGELVDEAFEYERALTREEKRRRRSIQRKLGLGLIALAITWHLVASFVTNDTANIRMGIPILLASIGFWFCLSKHILIDDI